LLLGISGGHKNDDAIGNAAAITFSVTGGKKERYCFPVIKGEEAPLELAVPLQGQATFVLKVDGSEDWAHANWAGARVELADGRTLWLGERPFTGARARRRYRFSMAENRLRNWPRPGKNAPRPNPYDGRTRRRPGGPRRHGTHAPEAAPGESIRTASILLLFWRGADRVRAKICCAGSRGWLDTCDFRSALSAGSIACWTSLDHPAKEWGRARKMQKEAVLLRPLF